MNRLFTKVDTSPKDTSAYPLDWSKLKKKKNCQHQVLVTIWDDRKLVECKTVVILGKSWQFLKKKIQCTPTSK